MNLRARRVLTLAVGTLLLLFLGLIYAYSVLMAPLKAQFDWSVSGMTLIFAISIVAFTIGNLLAGKIESAVGVRPVYLLGAALLLAGFVGSSLVDGPSALAVVYLTYGVLASLGIGLVYNVVIPVVTSWFPDACGMAQGVSLMGFGMGGFLLGPVAAQLYTVLAWRVAFVGVGVVFSALTVACSLILREPTADELAKLPAAVPAQSAGGADAAPVRDCGVAQMVGDRTFRLLYVFLFMLGSVGMGITGIGKELPASLGADALGAAFVIGFVNVGNGLGRLVAGTLLDRLGRGRTMVGVGLLSMVGTILLVLSLLGGEHGPHDRGVPGGGPCVGRCRGLHALCDPHRVGHGQHGLQHGRGQHLQHLRRRPWLLGCRPSGRAPGLLHPRPGHHGLHGRRRNPRRPGPCQVLPLVPPMIRGTNKGTSNCSCRLSRTAWLLPK